MKMSIVPVDIEAHTSDLIRVIPRLGFTIMKMRVEFAPKNKCRSAHIDRNMRVKINKEYMEGIPPLQRIAILQHEAMHVIHRHWERLCGVSQPQIRQVAEEISINQYIENLPKDCLTVEMYNLDRGKSLEDYYKLLLEKAKKNPKSFQAKFDANPLKGDADNLQEVDTTEADLLCKDAEQYEKAVGKESGDMFEQIEIIPTNYRAMVRRFIGTQPSRSKIKRSFSRRSRRFAKSPGIKKELELGNAIFGLDTSGSMSKDELGQSIDVANKVAQVCAELIFIQCDTDIKDVEHRKSKKITTFEVKGRGGTELNPIFEKAKEFNYPKTPLIIFTDGELWEYPKLEDMKNSIWIFTSKKHAKQFHDLYPTVDYAVVM
jgi:predicted metal-dependent peptidase